MTDYDRLKYRGTFNKLLCDKKRIINFLLKFRRITIGYFDIKDKKKKGKTTFDAPLPRAYRGQLVFFKQVGANGNCLSETYYLRRTNFFHWKKFLSKHKVNRLHTQTSRQRKAYKTNHSVYPLVTRCKNIRKTRKNRQGE